MKQRSDGRWQKSVSINGERLYFYSTAKTEAAAIKDINRQILQYREEDHTSKHNFLKIAEEALESKSKCSYKTYECYRNALKHLEVLHSMNIEDITAEKLQAVLDDMADKKYSFSAISKAKIFFGIVFKYAVLKKGFNAVNFLDAVKIPSIATKGSVHSPDDETILRIIKTAHSIDFGAFGASLYYLGGRRGEFLALQGADVNLERRIIIIDKAVEFIGNQPHIKTTKSKAGERILPITDAYLPIIETLIADLKDTDYIFGGAKPLTKTMFRKKWEKYQKELGCKVNPHQLRHAYATILYEAGIDVKAAQSFLGHANIQTTMDIYTHLSEAKKADSVSVLDKFLTTF